MQYLKIARIYRVVSSSEVRRASGFLQFSEHRSNIRSKNFFRYSAIVLLVWSFLSPFPGGPLLGYPQSATYQIDEVRFDGNRRIDVEALRVQLGQADGSISRKMITEDIKNLYKTGFFDQVTASVVEEDTQPPKRVLRYKVVEKPIVRKVFIKGNEEVDESDLSEIFTFGTMRFLDRGKVESLIRSAESMYEARGFYDASFDYSIVPIGDNQVDLTFTVTEGEKYHIDEIVFRGLDKVDEDELREAIQTKRYKWWNSWLFGTGRVNREMLENDRQVIRQYFFDHGFIDASVSEALVEKLDEGLRVSFDLSEGEEYSIGEIKVSGDLVEGSEEKTLDGIKTEEGEVFNASALREDSFAISEKFSDVGYAFVNVVPNTLIQRDSNEVNIEFQVDKGKLVRVNRIKVRGNQKTYDNVIRRELNIGEQELYSGSKIRRSEQLLERLGYFEEVNISNEATQQDDEIDLSVNVREGSTGAVSAGAGYSSGDGALFNARLSENNFLGTGRRVVLNADIGTRRENLILSFDDRRFNDSHWGLGADALKTERQFRDFDRDLLGGSLRAGYPFEQLFDGEWAEDVRAGFKYEYLDIDINNVNPEDAAPLVIESQGTSSVSGVTPSITRNTINNPLFPSEGSQQTLSFEITGAGGNEEYYLFEVANKFYDTLLDTEYGKFIFAWRTRFGHGEAIDDDPFPLFRRYFPGGINSVRGFKDRTMGPKDEDGNEFGGSKQLINNLEIIFPLLNAAGLNGVAFYDFGEAFDDNESITWDGLRKAYGAGLRWNSPLGPIRIEFGFPIDREPGEDSMVTLFSFGAPL